MPWQSARRAARKAKAETAASPHVDGPTIGASSSSSQAGRSATSAGPPRSAGMLLPLAETLEYNERPGEERAIIQTMAHMIANNEGAPGMAGELVPKANRYYRRAMEGCVAAQRLVDMAKDILPELALRQARATILDDVDEAVPGAEVSVSFAEGAEGRLCNQLAESMETANEAACVKKVLAKQQQVGDPRFEQTF